MGLNRASSRRATAAWDTAKGPCGIDAARLKTETDLCERGVAKLKVNIRVADGKDTDIRLQYFLKGADAFLKSWRFVLRALRGTEKLEYPYFGYQAGGEADIRFCFSRLVLGANALTR